jgi:hypothetical protein
VKQQRFQQQPSLRRKLRPGYRCWLVLAAWPAGFAGTARAEAPLLSGSLSLNPLHGPELPILLVLVVCLVVGLAVGKRRGSRQDRAGAAPPPSVPAGVVEAGAGVTASEVPANEEVAGWLTAIEGAPVRHVITPLPFRIGRAMTNELVLSDASVSRFHAEVDRRADGALAITDLDSLNGVFIGGKRVNHSRLFDGCRLEIGDVAFRYTREPPSLAAGGTLVLTLPKRRRS